MVDDSKWIFKWSELGQDEVYFDAESDPELQPFTRQAGSTIELSKLYQGIPYAGTSTIEEILELERLMSALISQKEHTYQELESYLITLGYNTKLIRRTFKKLTGMDPEETLCTNYLDTPPSIPQMNLGWGESKNKNVDFYFIMPWRSGYAIFAQRGDVDRELIDEYATLGIALNNLKLLVKEVYLKERDFNTSIKSKFMDSLKTEVIPGGFGVKMSAEDDTQNKEEKNEKDVVQNELEDAEFFDNKPPSELLDDSIPEEFPSVEIMAEIMKYMDALRDEVKPYILDVSGFKLIINEPEQYDNTPKTDQLQVTSPSFAAPAVISVVFTVSNGERKKKGLSVFIYNNDGKLLNNGTFKGSNSKIYALSREGLDAYFGGN